MIWNFIPGTARIFLRILTTSFLLAASLSAYAGEEFTLDPQHTYVLWKIKHLGFSTQAGKWYAKGSLILDKENPQNSKVNATIDVASITTGLAELDKHLKGPQFFDVAHYPTATFTSNKVDVIGKDEAKVQGTLTVHGISKAVTLMVKLNKVGINPISNKMTAGFSATTEINRSDFNMKTLLPDLSNLVALEIGAEAYLSKEAAKQ